MQQRSLKLAESKGGHSAGYAGVLAGMTSKKAVSEDEKSWPILLILRNGFLGSHAGEDASVPSAAASF
jgi:hypothetical protein